MKHMGVCHKGVLSLQVIKREIGKEKPVISRKGILKKKSESQQNIGL